MYKRKITMTIDDEIFSEFKQLCKSNAMKVSSKVELMMKEFVDSKKGDKDE
ncbi:hypothetical protein ACFL1B_02390 [Nanoarchaeota archaeon]